MNAIPRLTKPQQRLLVRLRTRAWVGSSERRSLVVLARLGLVRERAYREGGVVLTDEGQRVAAYLDAEGIVL